MKKVLLLIDLQNDFVTGSLGTVEAQSIIPNVVKLINSWQDEIYVTRDTHYENYLNSFEGQRLPVEHCIMGTQGWDLHPEIDRALNGRKVTIIDKPTFGATKLLELFSYDTDFTVVGLCTDICVISNVLLLKAKYYFDNITVIENCCAGVTPEKHKAAIEVMKSCQINVIPSIDE